MIDIRKFGAKTLIGIIVWIIYTVEFLVVLIFFEVWLDLPWVTSLPLEGNSFFSGVAWLLLFLIWTIFSIFATEAAFNLES